MMKFCLIALVALAMSPAAAENTVTVPWGEFKQLYTERLEDELAEKYPKDELTPLYTIEAAAYSLTIGDSDATAQIALRGKVLRGKPKPIPLFARDIAVTGVDSLEAASLLGDETGLRLQVEAESTFSASLSAAVPIQTDDRSRFVAFHIPAAVQSSLELTLPAGIRLVEPPGPMAGDGRYYLPPGEELRLRFENHGDEARPPSIDTFTLLEAGDDKLTATTYFAPLRPTAEGPLRVRITPAARYLGSSLSPSWVRYEPEQGAVINLPRDWRSPFELRYEISLSDSKLDLLLPRIDSNTGREGEFQIREPMDARMSVSGDDLRQGVPVARLPAQLREATGVRGVYARAGTAGPLQVELMRYLSVETPETVLDAVHFYTSYADDGSSLAVLRLALPETAGPRLELKPIPDAEIWSLSVNGTRRNVYQQSVGRPDGQSEGNWIINLDTGKASLVELAYLHRGEKLGLKGKLEFEIPEIGIAARRVNVSVGLSKRVQLIAMEGDLLPAKGKDWPKVDGFSGRAYRFTRPFYRGRAVSGALYYKEPVKLAKEQS